MTTYKAYDYKNLYGTPINIGRTVGIEWAQNEHDVSHFTAGYLVGRDIDSSHFYVSLNPEHVKNACCGRISDEERLRLGIEKISSDSIRSIASLVELDNTVFIPRKLFDEKFKKDEKK